MVSREKNITAFLPRVQKNTIIFIFRLKLKLKHDLQGGKITYLTYCSITRLLFVISKKSVFFAELVKKFGKTLFETGVYPGSDSVLCHITNPVARPWVLFLPTRVEILW